MCDLETIYGILLGVNICLIAAIVTCGIAIGLNLGFFTAWSAPVVFGISVAGALMANIALLPIINMLSNCTSTQCTSIASDATGLIGIAAGSLAAGIAVAYFAMPTAAVPVIGSGAMGGYAPCLTMATVFLMFAIQKLQELESCLKAPPPVTSNAVLITGGLALFLTLAGMVIYGLFSIGNNKK